MRILSIATTALLLGVGAASAQSQSTTPSKSGCTAAVVPAPTTPPQQDSAAGTAPGNTGNTGFSGSGLGGSFTGTSPNGPVAGSPSVQPATAKGLDPIGSPKASGGSDPC